LAIRRRELISGSLALFGLLMAGPAAFGSELNLGRISQIPTKGAKVFFAARSRILVYRRTARKFSAFIAICPNDATNLNASHLRGATFICPKDKIVFSAASGKRVSGVSSKPLSRVPIRVVNGSLVATLTSDSSPSSSALIESSKVPVGGGVKVQSNVGVLMIVQPSRGNFAAFSAICTHLGCEVSRATSQAITCTCHNSQFSTANGSVLSGPAEGPLRRYSLVERSGQLYLS
jgi:nitrite reductase/ring-hydroxylating ferredoxin subunit